VSDEFPRGLGAALRVTLDERDDRKKRHRRDERADWPPEAGPVRKLRLTRRLFFEFEIGLRLR